MKRNSYCYIPMILVIPIYRLLMVSLVRPRPTRLHQTVSSPIILSSLGLENSETVRELSSLYLFHFN